MTNKIDLPTEFKELSKIKQTILVTWINENLSKKESINRDHSSYGLKHYFEDDTGNYITNGEFKGAMLKCGFTVGNSKLLNWNFNISERSLTIIRKRIW